MSIYLKPTKRKAHLDLGSVFSSSSKQAKSTQQDVCVGTEANGLHRVGRVSPASTVTYNITHWISTALLFLHNHRATVTGWLEINALPEDPAHTTDHASCADKSTYSQSGSPHCSPPWSRPSSLPGSLPLHWLHPSSAPAWLPVYPGNLVGHPRIWWHTNNLQLCLKCTAVLHYNISKIGASAEDYQGCGALHENEWLWHVNLRAKQVLDSGCYSETVGL